MQNEPNKNGHYGLDLDDPANWPELERQFQEELAADPSPLAQAILVARREYLENGGKYLTIDEINAEVAACRTAMPYDD